MINRNPLPPFPSLILLILLCMLTMSSCDSNEIVKITFSYGQDDDGSIAAMIQEFNMTHEGEIAVEFKEGKRLSNQFYDELSVDFSVGGSDVDVWGADVVWTALFATKGWAEDLTDRFNQVFHNHDFIDASIKSATYDDKIWGIPWFTEAGLLYYRKDLLQKHGIQDPPRTWEELVSITNRVKQDDSGVLHGFVFQADAYEGGVVNACEFIWNAGGELIVGDVLESGIFQSVKVDADIIAVNSLEAEEGLAVAARLVREKVCPSKVDSYREFESLENFMDGKCLFMRGWPAVYGEFMRPGASVTADMVGVAALPTVLESNPSFSCLGGWNLMINASATEARKEASWKFILYLTDPASQQYRLERAGTLPSLKSLYNDADLAQKVPILQATKTVILNARSRPTSPYYMEMSPFISTVFQSVVRRTLSPRNAVSDLEVHLEKFLDEHKLPS
ncbi:MAG: ABC transporter substrate-binding protein [Saprospiraceae bacterium]|nr:ABC transporter substrate-binding protein [Saprospiraceae bacterium]